MIVTRPTRSSLSSRKEGRARLHRASGLWKGGPRISADLVNRPQDFPLGFRGDSRRCSVRSFNVRTSSTVPDCLSSFLKEYRAPHCAVMLSSQLAILVQGRGETSLPVGQLPRRFLPDRMLDQWLHGRKSRERSLCPFHLAFKVANHSHGGAVVNYCSWISLFRVSTLVPNGTF